MVADKVDDDEPLDLDEPQSDDPVPPVSFDVTSFGSDPEVEVLVRRMQRKDIIIPTFQRDYVWNQPEASKFIESLLLGLPVPGLFFATDIKNKQLVIDGQQRLKTLLYFYEGYFNPRPDDDTKRVFKLVKVQPAFEGRSYKTLDEKDRIRLDTATIHTTTIKQSSPPGDDTSLYHIFERLNSGGRRLTDQEMRLALYHGNFIDLIKKLNLADQWRRIFGKPHSRLKDQELILRFFALYENLDRYQRPLGEFLNKYAGRNQNASPAEIARLERLFSSAIDVFYRALGTNAFRPVKTFNVAVYDSCMVGVARRLNQTNATTLNYGSVAQKYNELFNDADYVESISRSTADEKFVQRRIEKAIDAFADC